MSVEGFSYEDVAGAIDHALLKPTLTPLQVEAGCLIAARYRVVSVCVKPCFVDVAKRALAGSAVETGTVVGFPHGAHAPAVKAQEARQAIDDGATELDMVVNLGWVLGGQWEAARQDIAGVLGVARAANARVKVIFENACLEREHKVRLCGICAELGVDWVKTSTGFADTGATPEDVRLMVEHVPESIEVKAAGGVRDLDTALLYLRLGCTRLGASATAEILDEFRRREGGR